MALRTTGEVVVDVDRSTAFAFVRDPERLARCIPGCSNLQALPDGRYAAVLTGKVAFITLSFKVLVELVKVLAPDLIEARIVGDGIAVSGRVTATAGLQLFEQDEGHTRLRYEADVALTGKLGGMGEPAFRSTSATLAKDFASNLKAAIERGATEVRA